MIKEKTITPNAELRTPNSFEHGGNIYRLAEELGVPEGNLIDFSASINPLGVSRKVKNVIKNEMNSLINYPDPETKMLREELSQFHDIDPETIVCGNGSTELIYLIPRALKPKKLLIPAPTFSEYERACKTSNKLQVISYKLKKENKFMLIPDEFISEMTRIQNSRLNSKLLTLNSAMPYGIAFLCNPNNPTGHLLRRDEVLKIAGAAKDMGCFLVVDEAFIDFCPSESVIDAVNDNPYLIVLRSMTKFYALTGLRIGYGIFHENLIGHMKHFKEPWTVNNLAQKAAMAALEDDEYSQKTFRLMKEEKDFLEKSFGKMGIEFYSSAVNFYLLNVGVRHAVPRLSEKGILVRDCSSFKGLDGSYIRIAVKSRKQNHILLKELKHILSSSSVGAGFKPAPTK